MSVSDRDYEAPKVKRNMAGRKRRKRPAIGTLITSIHGNAAHLSRRMSPRLSMIIEITLARGLPIGHHISMKLEIAARQLESLGSPVRLKIYRALVRAGDDGLACGVLQEKVGLAASTLSHHIRHLRETGLVSQERQATTLICRANYPAMNKLIGYLADECCADAACRSEERAA